MKKVHYLFYILMAACVFLPYITQAESIPSPEIVRAKVINVSDEGTISIPGTELKNTYQHISVEILEGDKKGRQLNLENDFIKLEIGDVFFLQHTTDPMSGNDVYTIKEVDRRGILWVFVGLFIATILVFSGKQGVRSLLSLLGSFFVILYILLPSLLAGYPPVLTSMCVASVILFLAIYLTHGFNKQSTVAFVGTVLAVALTGILAYVGVTLAHFSGFSSDEAMYLNLDTKGTLDFTGLLLAGIMIGILGVLDDIAVTQAAVVSEIYNSAPHLTRKEVYKKALRVGREHVGALVNTLALAYTGASLPLLLLFSMSQSIQGYTLNQEIFAVEIMRTIVGSIGLVLTVPITTLLAVYFLKNYKHTHHGHAHHH